MRIKRRLGVVFALAATVALAAAGTAIATTSTKPAGPTDFKITSASPPFGNATEPAKLYVNTHTEYDSGTFPGTFTNRTQLFFDKNMQINQSAVPVRCTDAQLSGATTMASAMNTACTGGQAKAALVGSGTAEANAASEGDSKGCVLAFNRSPNGILLFTRVKIAGPISCANANTNGAGDVPVLLKAGCRPTRPRPIRAEHFLPPTSRPARSSISTTSPTSRGSPCVTSRSRPARERPRPT